ncbi:hypothetical protein WR25_10843 [Diploscapter pachys]|uniref:Uncharacterized protein n=1 Tax=Diploscapter pachys TaxID=2018661 RepID=A0A2A2LBL5_9BILA|nr:hypothetical protein WR25_10843 [Diploscapter pachys]
MPNRDDDGEVEVDTISGRKGNEDRKGRRIDTHTERRSGGPKKSHLGPELRAKRSEKSDESTTAQSKGTANNKLTDRPRLTRRSKSTLLSSEMWECESRDILQKRK